jgi:hypothetical protein
MHERQRLLALLEIYDTAIEELYVLGDRRLVDLILRLERRRRDAAARLDALEGDHEQNVSRWVAQEIASAAALRPQGESRLRPPDDVANARPTLRVRELLVRLLSDGSAERRDEIPPGFGLEDVRDGAGR